MVVSRASEGPERILFIDDDVYGSALYVGALEAVGFRVDFVHDVDTAVAWADGERYDAVIIDIMMPHGQFFDQMETAGGYRTGIALGRELRDRQPGVPMIALTNSRDADVEAWYNLQPEFGYFYKGDYPPEEFALRVRNKTLGTPEPPRCFIVHGHDTSLLLALKNFLETKLGFPEPVVLSQQPSHGMTLIEKFEHYAEYSNLVFALFTPDDFREPGAGRARQNVLFEYGYFLGLLGRRTGRVFLLLKEGTEIPSDLRGVIYIDVTNGIDAAAEAIRRELRGLIPVE
jgi:CheY-like chemotaxis protein